MLDLEMALMKDSTMAKVWASLTDEDLAMALVLEKDLDLEISKEKHLDITWEIRYQTFRKFQNF